MQPRQVLLLLQHCCVWPSRAHWHQQQQQQQQHRRQVAIKILKKEKWINIYCLHVEWNGDINDQSHSQWEIKRVETLTSTLCVGIFNRLKRQGFFLLQSAQKKWSSSLSRSSFVIYYNCKLSHCNDRSRNALESGRCGRHRSQRFHLTNVTGDRNCRR